MTSGMKTNGHQTVPVYFLYQYNKTSPATPA